MAEFAGYTVLRARLDAAGGVPQRLRGAGWGPRRCLVRHDPKKAPPPLAAKGVLKRWGLPEGQTYIGLPDIVFDVLMRRGVTPGEFQVFCAMLRGWNWRKGMRQSVSVSAISRVLHRGGRSTARSGLRGLSSKGIVLLTEGTRTGGRVVVDLALLRGDAQTLARGGSVDVVARAPRNGVRVRTEAQKVTETTCPPTGQGLSTNRTPHLSTNRTPTCPPTGHHSDVSEEEPEETDAPRSVSLSLSRQEGEGEEAFRERSLALLNAITEEESRCASI